MFSFFRRSRKNKKAASKQVARTKPAIRRDFDTAAENPGYNPYDTLSGRSRDQFGMQLQDDGKWSF